MAADRAQWLDHMRAKAEALYDQFSPRYWVEFGLYPNERHREYIQKLLDRVHPGSDLLSAACGAGRYDGILLEAGHNVVGIDQSAGMLARAREHYPHVTYARMGLQEIRFQDAFAGIICVDAMEHVCPEDWPLVMERFCQALMAGGLVYFTLDQADADELETAYARAVALGLPVVFGEVADRVDDAFEQMMTVGPGPVPVDLADAAVYHYHPPLTQVRCWVEEAGMAILEEGMGDGYIHFLAIKIWG